MKKICSLLFSFLFFIIAFSQEKLPNPKTGKNETEIASFMLVDYRLAFGGQLVYRFSWRKNLKIGAGGLYGGDYDDSYSEKNVYGYGAAFADVMQFIGQRQKWSIGSQIGHGFYNREFGSLKLKAGIYYTISGNYRAIISKKLLIATSLFIGYRNFHYKAAQGLSENNSGLIGLKAGIVF
jgi:hypothetical protein